MPTPLESARPGLSHAEAEALLGVHGPNRPPTPPRRTLAARTWAQLRDPMIMLLIGAGVLTTILRDLSDTVIIAAVVVFNTVTGLVQEARAERAVAALKQLAPARTRVWRAGELIEVSSEDVVPGDVLALDAGDVVAADVTVDVSHQLQLDESMMTGESVPVDHGPGDTLEAGTLVTRGRARVQVTRTGSASGLGRLAAMLAETSVRATPLQRRLAELSRILVVVVLLLVSVVVALGLVQGRPLGEMAVVGVSLAVAAVPESLPAVLTVALAMGAHRMARRNAVVRQLPAVETLGSVTVIASDKTGTLTEGRMVAERLWTPTGEYEVSGRGYDADGGSIRRISCGPGGPDPADDGSGQLHALLRDGVLCNDAYLVGVGAQASVVGDPLEGALHVVAAKSGPHVAADALRWERTGEIPFDHERRHMTTVHREPDGRNLSVRKGAPEIVLAMPAPEDATRRAALTAERWASQGYRVIAVVEAPTATPADEATPWRLVGLVGIDDPPRSHISAVVERTRRAGIGLLLVTGDHPATARAVAERVGIVSADDPRSEELVRARVRPEEKVEVVADLQDRGEVVAMLGDGVNDAPALKRADIGVAAGLGGTEVAREASDLVLLDDDLSTVVAAVEEGRRIFTNIRMFLLYALSGGAAEIGVMLLGPAVGIAIPLLPAQILWINLLTHGLTGVAFGAEPADPTEMTRPPRSPSASIFSATFVRRLGLAAALLVVTTLSVGLVVTGDEAQRTAIFLTLGLGQLAVAAGIRVRHGGRRRPGGLPVALAGAATLLLLGTVASPLQQLLGTVTPTGTTLAAALVAAAVPGAAMRIVVVRAARREQVGASGTDQGPTPLRPAVGAAQTGADEEGTVSSP